MLVMVHGYWGTDPKISGPDRKNPAEPDPPD